MLDWLIHSVVSGQALFLGSGLLVLGIAADLSLTRRHDHIGRRVAIYTALMVYS